MYNCDRVLATIATPSKVTPYEPSTIDFLSLSFKERMVVDVTIQRANNPPIVVTLTSGQFISVKFVLEGELYKAAGKIRSIRTVGNINSTPESAGSGMSMLPCMCRKTGSEYFIITIDCSDRYESRMFDIVSTDIRDIDIINMDDFHHHHHHDHDHHCHHTCTCDCCNKKDPDTTPDTPTEEESGGSLDITPDEDMETDTDFGTDTDVTNPDEGTTDTEVQDPSTEVTTPDNNITT